MTISANTVLEVRLTGSDTNGGGFVTGASGTDWSLQNAAQYSVTDGVTNGTTTITSATAAFGTDVVGNLIYVTGGTGAVVAGWYEITARASATSITVDRVTGLTAGTGVTLKIGGALASPGQASAIAQVAGMTVFIKYNASPYVATTASTNVAGGCVSGTSQTAYVGYDTNRTVFQWPPPANRPTFQIGSAVSTATLFGNLNADYICQSIILDGNSQTSSKGIQSSGNFYHLKAMNCTTSGIVQNSAARVILCEATGCTTLPFQCDFAFWCVSHNNTLGTTVGTGGFQGSNQGVYYGCLSYGNNCNGFAGADLIINCVAYGNGVHGFTAWNSGLVPVYVNCIAENNTLWGYQSNSTTMSLINCANTANPSGRVSAAGKLWADVNPITQSAGSFFNNAAGGDFTLNNTTGRGALCRAAGFPTSFPVPALNNYLDIGALQHLDAGGSSGPVAQLKSFGRGAPY